MNKYQGNFGNIPLKYLPYFELSLPENLFDAGTKFHYETIFNILKNKNQKYLYLGTPNTSGKLSFIKNNLIERYLLKFDIFFLFIGDLDFIGHKYGGNSKEYNLKLKEILEFINEIERFFIKNKSPYSFLLFGDHGMVDVNYVINIQEMLVTLPLKTGKDYIYFLDSTMARFWFFNQKAQNVIFNSIPNSNSGRWISDEEKRIYHINYHHNKFGDAIWWANGGTIISPNFWQGKKLKKGMHGYRSDVSENHTCLIADTKYEYSDISLNMVEVNKILKKHLEID